MSRIKLSYFDEKKMNSALSVLIVDDNVKMRSLIAEIIKTKTKNVFECTNGLAAIGKYRIHQPDWVLMDMKMKKMDGLKATELMHQYFPKAKILIISQDGTPEMRRAARHAGAAAFVLKENLLDILSTLNQ